MLKIKLVPIILFFIFTTSVSAIANAGWIISTFAGTPGYFGTATGINESGQVAGYSSYKATRLGSADHAFITGPNGVGVSFLDIYGTNTFFTAINNSGQVIGTSGDDGSTRGQPIFETAFITGPNATGMTLLIAPDGGKVRPTALNDLGQVVGVSYTPDGISHTFITGPNGTDFRYLESPDGSKIFPTGINNSGQVTGNSPISNHISRLFITGPNGVGLTYLETFGGNNSFAYDINESGQIVGWSEDAAGNIHGFITGENGSGIRGVGAYEGATSGYASAINDFGNVVGVLTIDTIDNGFDIVPFLYSDGVMTDLSSLPSVVAAGWNWLFPTAINNSSQIVGYGWNGNEQHPFLLTYVGEPTSIESETGNPLPEPGTLLLVSFGFAGFVVARRKKNHSAS